jgi:twitching motility two-component system response regulator PilH
MNATEPKGMLSRLLACLLSKLPWAANKPPPPPSKPPPPQPSEMPPAPRLGKRILIIDDDTVILKILSRKLNARGYDILTAADPADALSVARNGKPDLILLDLVFPPDVNFGGGVGWDGFRVMNWLHTSGLGSHIPIFIISSEDPEHCKDRCLANGAVAFFQKPVDHDHLLSAIRQTLCKDPVPPKPALTSATPA